jgi:hypothetical protein
MMPQVKSKKLYPVLATLLLVALAIPIVLAENTQQPTAGQGAFSVIGKYPDVPGAPDNAVQYNKTNVTPTQEKEQVKAGEPALFQYRNMTMLMNSSQNCEVVFNSDQDVTPKILGLTVEPNQTMKLAMNMSKSPLQGEAVMQRALNFYLAIEPDATVQLQAQIRLHINQTELDGELNREVNASKLTWMFWNQTRVQWQAVESYMDQNGYLVCNTDHFSTWTVAEIEQSAATPNPPTENAGFPLEYVIIGATVAVVVIALGLIAYKKRK